MHSRERRRRPGGDRPQRWHHSGHWSHGGGVDHDGTAPAGGPPPARGHWPPWATDDAGPQWAARRPPAVVLPALLAAVQIIATPIAGHAQHAARPLDLLGYVLLAAGPAALIARAPRLRLPVYAITVLILLAYGLAGYPAGPVVLAALVALVRAARAGYRITLWVVTGLAYAAYVGVGQLLPGIRINGVELVTPSLARAAIVAAWLAVALAIAETVRARTAQLSQLMAARAEAARARTEQSRRQASEERLAIARELHDVLGHHLSLINVRAGVALHLIESRPEEARAALGAIKQASAEALREVRTMLTSLRPDAETAPLAPAPDLDRLDDLIAEASAGGLPVTLRRTGPAAGVPAEVGRAAYRIVQEALTNVRRHAGPDARATVTVRHDPGSLTVRVADDGAGPGAAPADGNGLPGMRARATALGGTLTADPTEGGGFAVTAVLPTDQGDDA
ncbi:sensor histidine kinase [Luedemannella helvata]|uniref:sensor histidine kinase n=1 Tax=Luedemannella helvata TaxID=349315 RepID=UPI0031CFB303